MNKVKAFFVLAALVSAVSLSFFSVSDASAQTGGQDPGALIGIGTDDSRDDSGNDPGPGGSQGDPDTWQIDAWHADFVRVDRPGMPIDRPWDDAMSFILALILRITLFAIW